MQGGHWINIDCKLDIIDRQNIFALRTLVYFQASPRNLFSLGLRVICGYIDIDGLFLMESPRRQSTTFVICLFTGYFRPTKQTDSISIFLIYCQLTKASTKAL